MKRMSLFIGAVAVAVLVLALTAWPGLTALSGPEQLQEGQITVWVSTTEDGELVRRLDPTASEAWVVVRSNLGTDDHDRYVVELQDASGISVFRSDTLALPTGPFTISVPISGTLVFQGYLDFTSSRSDALIERVDAAINALQGERNKPAPNPGRVVSRIEDVLAVQRELDAALERLRSFDNLEPTADTAFANAQADLSTVADEGNAAIAALQESEPDWDRAATRLQGMQDAAMSAVANIDNGINAVDENSVRRFPPTSIPGRCSQNQVILLAEFRDPGTGNVTYSPATDSWWTVGTPGAPARLTNPQQPEQTGTLQAQVNRLYATNVQVSGTVTTTTPIYALVLDEACLPVEGATVQFSVAAEDAGQATLSATEVATNANGEAMVELSTTDTLGDGTVQVNATVDSASASTTIDVIGPPASLRFLGQFGKWINFGVRSFVDIDVLLRDANGRDVADGTPVRFRIDPPDHTFSDNEVTTQNSRAVATLLLGNATGEYTVRVQAGGTDGLQVERNIRVVDVPSQLDVDVVDQDSGEPIDTIFVFRSNLFARIPVRVWSGEGIPAPDATVVQWELVGADDRCWASIVDPREDFWGHRRTTLTDGEATATLVAHRTSTGAEGCPPATQALSFERIEIKVTAFYCQDALGPGCLDERANPKPPVAVIVEKTITLDLRGYTVFVPLFGKD